MDFFQKKNQLDNTIVFYVGICLGAVSGVLATNVYFYFTSSKPVTPRLIKAKTKQIISAIHLSSEDTHAEHKPVNTLQVTSNDKPVRDENRDTLDKTMTKPYSYLNLLQMIAQQSKPKIKRQLSQEKQIKKLRELVAKHCKNSK